MEGVRVFVPDAEHVWLPAVITQSSASGKQLVVRLERVVGPTDASAEPSERELADVAGQERAVSLDDPAVAKALASRHTNVSSEAASLPLQNAAGESPTGYEDMITIDHLHEASILHNLRRRFFNRLPYTYTGKICIAVNPYQWLNLYDARVMAQFSEGSRQNKPPHVYAVSMEAFSHLRRTGENQSILVSGESGAGKTETTKIVMSHLATLAQNSDSKVIQQIIQANPLLESFGNAKTVRNDNSSRFGKFTELQFAADGQLRGAFSRTYLLEKSRVTTQAEGERNFHIFYQLLQQKEQFPELFSSNQERFQYLSTTPDPAHVADEQGDLTKTRQALELVGIGADLQIEMLQILAAILHLGETQFAARDGDVDASRIVDLAPFETVCRLLGVELAALERALSHRTVHVGREVILKPITRDQATDCRDALAKSLYAKLFSWLVEQINETIGSPPSAASSFIGILDIFGFEQFEKNSFEQFCINYANEKLQQKFVQDVLKTVQLEYDEEHISWSHVTFADNQDVLNLIEGRLGVLSFLNEESLLATGTDAAFASKLGAVMENNPLLETPRLNQCAFAIHHYAGKVTYDASGFLDKHRDAILPDIKHCMATSSLRILSKTYAGDRLTNSGANAAGTNSQPLARAASRKKMAASHGAQPKRSTVGSQFKESLGQLMDKIQLTEVHYVRCVKPNASKSARAFAHAEVVAQLRCAGVIEALRVSRAAYPSRLPHSDCLSKFAMLAPSSTVDGGASNWGDAASSSDSDLVRAQCEELLAVLLPGRHVLDYQVGLTRVYFRESVLEQLETRRAQALRKVVLLIQKNVRRFLEVTRFQRLRKSAVTVQKYWRRHVARRRFLTAKRGAVQLQARVRGQRARRAFRQRKQLHYLVRFQARCRAVLARRKYLETLDAARKIQSFIRVSLLRLVFLRRMEKEKKYQALGSKVARLQLRLDQKHHQGAAKMSPSSSGSGTSGSGGSGSGTPGSGGLQRHALNVATTTTNGSFGPRGSMMRHSGAGILDESQEVITALHEENERLRAQLDAQEDEVQKLKAEIRTLRNWQKSKEVDDKVQKIAHRDQESKDLSVLYALETEYEKLRAFVCDHLALPPDTGTIIANPVNPVAGSSVPGSGATSPPPPPPSSTARPAFERSTSTVSTGQPATDAQQLLLKSATRVANARAKTTSKGSARRVKDHWEEIRNFPPSMHYTIGSVPWKRLLTDWAQGNPKKLDYMTRWLKNVLDGGPIVSDTFPMGVELKYVTPMMLDGFMQLVIPKLAERPDVQVHVHTKEFIGTSMRITLAPLETNSGSGSRRGVNAAGNTNNGAAQSMMRPSLADHDDYRLSILANQSSSLGSSGSLGNGGGGGRFSTASTASLSSVEPPATPSTSQPRPSVGFFRSSRSNNSDNTSRGSLFRK